jgi:LytS/YehU family sensor histidine kinase
LNSAVIVPLYIGDEIIGSFSIIKGNGEEISPAERKLAEGISNLLSLQLEVARLNEQSKLLARAEFAALKAQVNPHFLFNTLSVIMSCCRSNPEEARELLVHLSHLLRRRLRENDDFVPLRDELEAINEYLAIIKVRFRDRLQVKMDIQEETMDCLIPVFSVQPLVENAVRHGLLTKEDNCYLELKAFLKTDHTLQVEVYDNGVGITPEVLERIKLGIKSSSGGVGLTNIMQRLKLLYGERGSFTLKTAAGDGTRAILVIPRM